MNEFVTDTLYYESCCYKFHGQYFAGDFCDSRYGCRPTRGFVAHYFIAFAGLNQIIIDFVQVKQFTPICDALSVNVGTLDAPQAEAISVAVKAAEESNKPWVNLSNFLASNSK